MNAPDIESLERATVEAVAPDALYELPGWLLPVDGGTIGRAHSAVPLTHPVRSESARLQAGQLTQIVDIYRTHNRLPAFRLPETAEHLHTRLVLMGFRRLEPSLVMVGSVSTLTRLIARPLPDGVTLDVQSQATPAWQGVFLGPGFDPQDGANRVRNLSRAVCNVFFSAVCGDKTLACGAASMGHGWLGVHGMRTAQGERGKGFATAILRAMAMAAELRGISRVFLQVGAANGVARSLYVSAGLHEAWAYAYWKPVA